MWLSGSVTAVESITVSASELKASNVTKNTDPQMF